jgi:hypothetical protein
MSDQLQFSFPASREARREAAPRAFRRKIDCTAPEAERDGKSLAGQPARKRVGAQNDAAPAGPPPPARRP